jgi:hypothetical protein
MDNRTKVKLERGSTLRFSRTILAVASLVALLSSSCHQFASVTATTVLRAATGAVAQNAARALARRAVSSAARNAARGIVRGVARGAARGVSRGVSRGVVNTVINSSSYTSSTYQYKYIQYPGTTTANNTRIHLPGFSYLSPPERGWRFRKQTNNRVSLVKTSRRVIHGYQTFNIKSHIIKRGHYSSNLKELQKQRRENFERFEKRDRYSNMKVKSAVVYLDNAGCIFTRATITDTGISGYEGKRYTVYADEVVCTHPHHKKMLVVITYYERVPPLAIRKWSPIKYIARSLKLNYDADL